MAAGLKVWRDSQWTGFLVMGSVKREVLLGTITGAAVGRVKGPICHPGPVAPRRAMVKRMENISAGLARFRVRIGLPVSFIRYSFFFPFLERSSGFAPPSKGVWGQVF